ncbi:alpha/beta fold hydrolase [Bradyrhizobium erythrophlei]|uniref:alpha/beta fold hydrolase n=1 Tax=Bradyrhizobium erythrophlei TaxID=1437360 RepID=UPI0035F0F074
MQTTQYEMEVGSVRANDVLFHYIAMGRGRLLLCLHGFPDHALSFRHQLRFFSALGYRVVAPFMRGYAPTQLAEDATFYTADLAHDVVELLRSFGATRATLLGHDWGAHAAYGAAVLAPEMFDRIVTLAVPYGPGLRKALVTSSEQQKRSWYLFFFLTRFAETALAYDDYALVEQLWSDWSPGWTPPPSEMAAIRATFALPGVASAALSYYRHALGTTVSLGKHAELQRRIGIEPIRVPCFYLHGDQDGCIGHSVASDMQELFPNGFGHRLVRGVGHFLHLERPDEVNAMIATCLAGDG